MDYYRAYVFAMVVGYLFGSIPFALIIGKVFYKTDIREHGSGNLGATNAGRVLGKTAGITVTLLDVFKATIAMLFFYLFKQDALTILLAGLFATIGHAFPVFADFKGGKSVATWFGFNLGICSFILHNWWPFVIPIAIFFGVLYLSKYVSLSSMTATVAGALISFLFTYNEVYYTSLALLVVALFIVYRHRANIKRILEKTESKISWM